MSDLAPDSSELVPTAIRRPGQPLGEPDHEDAPVVASAGGGSLPAPLVSSIGDIPGLRPKRAPRRR